MIELHQVTKEYRLGDTVVPALRGIDLTIGQGDFLAISGPSGSGKTSLLNLIGLVDRPTQGEIRLQGSAVSGLRDDALAEKRNRLIGYIFQSFNLVAVLSALENVMLPLQIQGASTRDSRRAALRCLDDVGVGALAPARPDKMSGGQRQRVAIARALVTRPALILADEPTANLDTETSMNIIALMRELNEREKVTFIFSTHDDRLLGSVKRRIRLHDGLTVQG
jgi:putative ABC transport system ATP-binding protein